MMSSFIPEELQLAWLISILPLHFLSIHVPAIIMLPNYFAPSPMNRPKNEHTK